MITEKNSWRTPICQIELPELNNMLYVKRDDLYPLSFGGNKARKAELFWKEIEEKQADHVVTYGTSSSNHCRVIANLAAMHEIPCTIISPEQQREETFNSDLMDLFGAQILVTPVAQVKETIDQTMKALQQKGSHPYFIMGGGHGNIGTQAYVDAYEEILAYEKETGIVFDRIFHASGTGTTQAGLVCGQIMHQDWKRSITGISIARKNPYGRDVVVQSVKDYLHEKGQENQYRDELVEFTDAYTGDGYGMENKEIQAWIKKVLIKAGFSLDPTYTGKAFWGMTEYLRSHEIKKEKILFIHTGGGPLFFDHLIKDYRRKV